MFRSLAALTALSLAVPAAAATYTASPASPSQARIAARDILWTCGADGCTGSTQNSRPVVLCEGLAKKAGRIESFAVNGQPIAAADLDRCNASAKADRNTAVATAR